MELLKAGAHVPAFALPDAHTGRRVEYAVFLRKRRVIVLALNDVGAAWLAGAVKQARAFAERDLTVLAIMKSGDKPDTVPDGFHVLHDADGAITERIGGAPAFYLVGKDTGIKIASRTCPTPAEIFRTIDAMPMRAREMRERRSG